MERRGTGVVGGRQLLINESWNLNQGEEDDAMVSGGATVVSIQTPFQQDISASQFKFGREFQRCVLNRIHGYQKSAYKLRILNQSGKERVEKGIQEAKISLLNIENLAKSQLGSCIKNLDVIVRGHIPEVLQNLPTLSPVYFESIQNINLIIAETFVQSSFYVNIQQPVIFSNLNVVNKSNLKFFYIVGKYEVVMRDCTFDGLSIACYKNAQVSVVNSQFTNAVWNGFGCHNCDSLFMDYIKIKDCGSNGCYIDSCENVSIDNIQVASCGLNGIAFVEVNDFKLRNAFIQDCGESGIFVYFECVGEIHKSRVQGCKKYGIYVREDSLVRYSQIQCDDNDGGKFDLLDDCQFLRMD